MSVCLGTGGGSDFVCRSIRMGEVSRKNVIKSYVSWDSDLTTVKWHRPGVPFDSEDHLFEIKWDGTRMLAFVDDGYRLVNRHGACRTMQYPELAGLARLPAGTILDGEMVVLVDSRPDFRRLLSRDLTCAPLRIRLSARALPATYVVFDLLYDRYRPLLNEPLAERRDRLAQLVNDLGDPHFRDRDQQRAASPAASSVRCLGHHGRGRHMPRGLTREP